MTWSAQLVFRWSPRDRPVVRLALGHGLYPCNRETSSAPRVLTIGPAPLLPVRPIVTGVEAAPNDFHMSATTGGIGHSPLSSGRTDHGICDRQPQARTVALVRASVEPVEQRGPLLRRDPGPLSSTAKLTEFPRAATSTRTEPPFPA